MKVTIDVEKFDNGISLKRKVRIIEANQVPNGGISRNIWSLPCVVSAYKTIAGNVRYRVETPYGSQTAKGGDWICKYNDGSWDVMTNEQYKAALN